MSLLNHAFAKNLLSAGQVAELYYCPAIKTNAFVDLSFFKENTGADSLIQIALATEANAANLTSVDYFFDDIVLAGAVNIAELSKIIVGSGERLYGKLVSGPDVSIRVDVAEESNVKVLKAGRLAAVSIPGTGQTQLYVNAISGAAYVGASITLYNPSSSDSAEVSLWVTNSETPGAIDKVLKVTIPTEDTTMIDNIKLGPTEKIFVQSSLANTEYFVNGAVVSL